MPLTISELRKIIDGMPDDGVVCIGGSLVAGCKVVIGRVSDGYYNQNFNETPKGRVKALKFTHRSEQSDGSIVDDEVV